MSDIQTLRLALVGNPNCGKTALFNRLTGARQKVANYAGVTVERKEGQFTSSTGRNYLVIDLPGAYSLNAITPDEEITRSVLFGACANETPPDVILLVADATNLNLNLRLALEVTRLNRPTILALNMMDVAKRRGISINLKRLQDELGIPVVETVAVQQGGAAELVEHLEHIKISPHALTELELEPALDAQDVQREVRRILNSVTESKGNPNVLGEKLDNLVLHPIFGYVLLSMILFFIFQAVFSWSKVPMDFIQDSINRLGEIVNHLMPDGILRSLLVDGILSGVGSVLVFLPQILILFFFILTLEESGYLPRAAFLLDRLMGSVGLSGRAFIPLLSSFACAIPGVMATRTIQNPRDRMITIMIAPLMTCSARLPVYALIISAFIPARNVGAFNLQGLVLFALYIAGILSAMLVASIFKFFGGNNQRRTLLLELPDYHMPNLRNLLLGLLERAKIFISRVGTVILAMMILIWFLSSFPFPPESATAPAITYSFASKIGVALLPIFAPLGFNWQIAVALIPGIAAREVAVGALGTVYALSGSSDNIATALTPMIAAAWSLPTALSLLAWYVFAPQCISTLSVVRRETNSWSAPLSMALYMFGLSYLTSFATYQISHIILGG